MGLFIRYFGTANNACKEGGDLLRLLEHPSLHERVYDEIKKSVIKGEIPPGSKIIEENIARTLGVSRTPIREALKRLAQEGLVEITPRKGAFVIQLFRRVVKEILEIREALEGMAARLAALNMTDDILDKMKKAFEGSEERIKRRDFSNYSMIDVDFHQLLFIASNNQRLTHIINNLYDHIQMLRLKSVILPGRIERSLNEHMMIIEALEKRDPDLAEKMAREHIRNVKIDILQDMESQEILKSKGRL